MLVLIYLTFVAFVFYWQIKKVKVGGSAKGKAIRLYAAYTIAPIMLYGAVFIALVGTEEITDASIIGEGYARSLAFVLAGGVAVVLLTTLAFSIVIVTMKRKDINAA